MALSRASLRRSGGGSSCRGGLAFDEHGDHAYAAFERCSDLEPHEVVGVVESAAAFLVGDSRPSGADQDHHDAARVDGVADDPPEIKACLDGVQVDEDGRIGETPAHGDLQQTRVGEGVRVAVSDEDPGSGSQSSSGHGAPPTRWVTTGPRVTYLTSSVRGGA